MNMLLIGLIASIISLISPDSRVRAEISADESLKYSLVVDGNCIIRDAELSMSLDDGTVWGRGRLLSVSRSSDDTLLPSPFYRKAQVRDAYNQVRLHFKGHSVVFRLADDAFSWRFEADRRKPYKVLSEQASFRFVEDYGAYVSYTHKYPRSLDSQFCDDFENVYSYAPLSCWDKEHMAHLPLMVELPRGMKAVIAESDLLSYPGMFLYNTDSDTQLEGLFAPVPDRLGTGGHNGLQELVLSRHPYIASCDGAARTFPWRIICLSRSDKDMADMDAVWRLASPCEDISAFSWVKPGRVAWDWLCNWNVRGVDFEAGINTATYKYFIDFAARHGIEYILLDEGWCEYGANDLFKIVPNLDLQEILSYADSKNVGVFLWAGCYPFKKDMERVCAHYSAMGVKGFKVDFLERDDQLMEDFILDAAQTAARYHLMLNFHGVHKPVGLQRRFPNIVNYEGIFGLEQMRKKGLPDYDMVKFDVTAPFIRFVAGFADYTQGALRNASYENFRPVRTEVMSQGTRCRQLAEYVVFDSPLTMLCDSPTDYEMEKDALDFICNVPTVWDETRILDGKVGEYIVTARRKGDLWYVGAMTDWTERELSFDPTALVGGAYTADCWTDGLVARKFANDYRRFSLEGNSPLTFRLAPGGGFATIIRRSSE